MLDALARAPHAAAAPAPPGEAATAPIAPRTFDATVAADGTVKLTDRPSAGVAIAGVQIARDYLAQDHTLGGPAGDPRIASKYEAAPGTAISLGSTSSVNAVDSALTFSHNVAGKGTSIVAPLLGGHFDASDALMRRHGADPYFARKLQYLDATRDERAQLGSLNRAAQLAGAGALMQRNLDALWADRRLDLAAKKRALFALWDECAEDGDARLVDGAAHARQLVLDFIRGHLPAGSAGAYTADELAALARHQQAKAAFRPYPE
ncbi:MAG TPA: hypothetical protein VFP84_19980 [Kofleriaceae bacterium]|nr:hypothetical protein [Kofleriaceae bacterium]